MIPHAHCMQTAISLQISSCANVVFHYTEGYIVACAKEKQLEATEADSY